MSSSQSGKDLAWTTELLKTKWLKLPFLEGHLDKYISHFWPHYKLPQTEQLKVTINMLAYMFCGSGIWMVLDMNGSGSRYLKMSGVQSSEGLTGAGSSIAWLASWCWLLIGGLSSSPPRLSSLWVAWVSSQHAGWLPPERESKENTTVPFMCVIHEVTHCHLCYGLFARSDSLGPAFTQREGN